MIWICTMCPDKNGASNDGQWSHKYKSFKSYTDFAKHACEVHHKSNPTLSLPSICQLISQNSSRVTCAQLCNNPCVAFQRLKGLIVTVFGTRGNIVRSSCVAFSGVCNNPCVAFECNNKRKATHEFVCYTIHAQLMRSSCSIQNRLLHVCYILCNNPRSKCSITSLLGSSQCNNKSTNEHDFIVKPCLN